MTSHQPGLLAPVPPLARYLSFTLPHNTAPGSVLQALGRLAVDDALVVGLGRLLVAALGAEVQGLRAHPRHVGPGFSVPSTPMALWCWLRGDDRGELLHRSRALSAALPGLELDHVVDAFMHRDSRDLTGYVDGTENPEGEAAAAAALVAGQGAGLDGSSFVATQRWVHDLEHFASLPQQDQDHIIGRRRSDNEEIEDAPASAHVKRTAQERFEPEAFLLRRSMPWADSAQHGLIFVAFGKSLRAYEQQLARMVGAEDGIVDGLFRFTRPVTGSTFWCPPLVDGHLDLRALQAAAGG